MGEQDKSVADKAREILQRTHDSWVWFDGVCCGAAAAGIGVLIGFVMTCLL